MTNTLDTVVSQNYTISVINLDRCDQRMDRIGGHLSGLGLIYNRVPAIDGQMECLNQSPAQYSPELNAKQFFTPLKHAEIACFQSHYKALLGFVKQQEHQVLLVLEDDVELLPGQHYHLPNIAAYMASEQPMLVKLYAKRKEPGRAIAFPLEVGECVLPNKIPLGFQAQMYNKAAANELLTKFKVFGRPIDVEVQFWWCFQTKIMLLKPNLIRELSMEVGGSTISPLPKPITLAKIKLELQRPWFRFTLLLISLYYRYKYKLLNK